MVQTGAGGQARVDLTAIVEDLIPAADEEQELGSEDKKWAAIWVAIALVTSITIGGIVNITTTDSWLFINASTWINESLNVSGNITAVNITASGYFFGNGSQLTDINYTETDSLAYNGTLAYLSDILGWSYYNSTDFDINDYLLSADWNATNTSYYLATNPFSFYNSTDFSIADYLLISNWNATNTSYYLVTNPFSFYNSTDFDIADYSTTSTITGWGYWNDTYATFNKTYADTLYSTIDEPLWTANFTAYNSSWSSITNTSYYLATNPFSFYNSTDFNIADYLLDTTDTFTGNLTFADANNCIIFQSGGKICSGV